MRFSKALGVNGDGGSRDRKAVLVGPTTCGVKAPCACTVPGVGGKRAGIADRKSGMGVKAGGPGVAGRLRLR